MCNLYFDEEADSLNKRTKQDLELGHLYCSDGIHMSFLNVHSKCWHRILLLMLSVLFLPQISTAATRQWTDKDGHTMSASFVRVSGDKAVLKRGRRVVQVPLSDLSQEDRDYIDGLKKGSTTRLWTVNGRKLRGSFRKYENGNASIDLGSRTRSLALDTLSDEDVEHIRRMLETNGTLDDLPESDPIKSGGIRGFSDPGIPAVKHRERTWTNDKGKEVEATFVRIDGENVILRRAKDGKELPVPLAKLSRSDQAFAKAEKMRADFDANVARNTPRMPTPPGFPGRAGGGINSARQAHDDMLKDMRERRKQREEQQRADQLAAKQRMDEAMARHDAQTSRAQESMEKFRRESEERRRKRQEAIASTNHGAVESASPTANRPSPPTTHSSPPAWQGGATEEVYVYVCTGCNAELPANIKAGDRCPSCREMLAYEEGPGGKRKYAKGVQIARWGRLIVFAVIFIIGGIMRAIRR